jgi:hypothetical protein
MRYKRILKLLIPWLITCGALWLAFRGLDWGEFIEHLRGVSPTWVAIATGLTVLSYLFRSYRWLYLFPEPVLTYPQATKALFLGFFMNNILPARAGELVRAHSGARLGGTKRTLVLATIASERLLDGLTISAFLILVAYQIKNRAMSNGLLSVAAIFALVLVGVLAVLTRRDRVFHLGQKLHSKFNNRASHYGFDRLQVFITGLTPLMNWRVLPRITIWSLIIWGTELLVYISVTLAYDYPLSLASCIIFMVAVNFSSLVPSAPAGLGVIEAIASQVLVALGVPKELALSMVITQHAIQFLVVGVIGAFFGLKKSFSPPIQNLQAQ